MAEFAKFHCATDRTAPSGWAFGADAAKLVHLVRHGQGIHNVEAALRGAEAYRMQSLKDASLDDTGRAQASSLGHRIRDARMQVDVILVSPLTRTMQTATEMFPEAVRSITAATQAARQAAAGHNGGGGSSAATPVTVASLMPAQVPGVPMFVAIEMCREAHGGHPCDQRRPIRVLRQEFPHVDFSLVDTDEDSWHDPNRRETVREVAVRGDKMLDILRSRSERNIVVVSHGVFLETLLNRCSLACVDEHLRSRRFDNAEMRSIVLGGWAGEVYPVCLPQPGRGALSEIVAATNEAAAAAAGSGVGKLLPQPATTAALGAGGNSGLNGINLPMTNGPLSSSSSSSSQPRNPPQHGQQQPSQPVPVKAGTAGPSSAVQQQQQALVMTNGVSGGQASSHQQHQQQQRAGGSGSGSSGSGVFHSLHLPHGLHMPHMHLPGLPLGAFGVVVGGGGGGGGHGSSRGGEGQGGGHGAGASSSSSSATAAVGSNNTGVKWPVLGAAASSNDAAHASSAAAAASNTVSSAAATTTSADPFLGISALAQPLSSDLTGGGGGGSDAVMMTAADAR